MSSSSLTAIPMSLRRSVSESPQLEAIIDRFTNQKGKSVLAWILLGIGVVTISIIVSIAIAICAVLAPAFLVFFGAVLVPLGFTLFLFMTGIGLSFTFSMTVLTMLFYIHKRFANEERINNVRAQLRGHSVSSA